MNDTPGLKPSKYSDLSAKVLLPFKKKKMAEFGAEYDGSCTKVLPAEASETYCESLTAPISTGGTAGLAGSPPLNSVRQVCMSLVTFFSPVAADDPS